MSNKYFGGAVNNPGAAEPVDDELKVVVCGTRDKVAAKMADLRVADAISEISLCSSGAINILMKPCPWALAREEEKKDRLATVLYNLVESIAIGANLLSPFMPETAEKILTMLNDGKREFDDLASFGRRENGVAVTDAPEILFGRLKLEDVMAEVEKRHPAAPEEPAPEADEDVIDIDPKAEITFEDFGKMQFQVGEIIACEEVKKSKKLLCSQVKIGSQVKQIVSGIKKYYSPEEMVGKKVMVLVNLKPAKLAGVLSEGMIL